MGIVLIKNSDGMPIEYQSDATPGTLIKNVVSAGLNPSEYHERVITESDYKLVYKAKKGDAEKAAKKAKKDQAISKTKNKLGLNDNQFEDLREALGL